MRDLDFELAGSTILTCDDCGHTWDADYEVSPGEPAICSGCWAADTELTRD